MKKLFNLSALSLIALLLSSCSVFEAINAANPLPSPEEYGKEANAMGKPFAGQARHSQMGSDGDVNTGATFSEWHDNQYK